MKVSLMLVVFAACLALCACADATCAVKITATARQDQYASWNVGAVHFQIFDIVVTNQGTCPLTRIVGLFIAQQQGGFISEAWNYNSTNGVFSSYGSALNVGQSFYGAGLVLANASSLTLSVTLPSCPSTCYNATSAPTTSAPTTSAPTSNPSTATPTTTTPTTMAPTTTTPTTMAPTTTAPSSCRVTAVIIRDSNWWMDAQGKNNSVYRLSLTNNSPCALVGFIFSANFGSGTLVSYWNLQPTTGGYSVSGFGPSLASGQTFTAAGMILAGAPDNITLTPYATSCASC